MRCALGTRPRPRSRNDSDSAERPRFGRLRVSPQWCLVCVSLVPELPSHRPLGRATAAVVASELARGPPRDKPPNANRIGPDHAGHGTRGRHASGRRASPLRPTKPFRSRNTPGDLVRVLRRLWGPSGAASVVPASVVAVSGRVATLAGSSQAAGDRQQILTGRIVQDIPNRHQFGRRWVEDFARCNRHGNRHTGQTRNFPCFWGFFRVLYRPFLKTPADPVFTGVFSLTVARPA